MLRFRFITALFLFFVTSSALAGSVVLKPGQKEVPVGRYMDVLEDSEGEWDFEQIRGEFSSRFRLSDSSEPNFGFTSSVFWLRFTLDASAVRGENWYLVERYPIIDDLTLFRPRGDGSYETVEVGDTQPFSERLMAHRAFVFPLDTDVSGPQQYYVRVSGQGAINLLPMLFSAKGLVEYTYLEQLLMGLFYGSIVIMLIYNLLLCVSLRDRVYLYFVLFLAGILFFVFNVNGFGLQFLWPDYPKLNQYFWLGSYLACAALAFYARSFLQLPSRYPRYDRLIRRFLAALGIAFVVQWLLEPPVSYLLSVVVVLVTVLLFSWLGWVVLRSGFWVARLYVLAWSVFLLLIFIFALGNLNVIPFTGFVPYLPHIGTLWVVVMLSLALGDRIRYLERERKTLSLQAQENLQRHLADIEQMNRDKSTFLQYISHELNTPINWIGAANEADMKGDNQDVWALVRKGQRRLVGIVGTCLRYFDLTDREGPPLVGACQPMWLLDSVIRERGQQLKASEITVNNRIAPNLRVQAYSAELTEVFDMAIDNALRFSPDGGQIDVTSEVNVAGGYADISIRDYGRGATAEQLSHIFEPFFVTGSGHHEDGYGLSLSMARIMIEQIGGSLWAASDGPGKGFALVVRLPLAVMT